MWSTKLDHYDDPGFIFLFVLTERLNNVNNVAAQLNAFLVNHVKKKIDQRSLSVKKIHFDEVYSGRQVISDLQLGFMSEGTSGSCHMLANVLAALQELDVHKSINELHFRDASGIRGKKERPVSERDSIGRADPLHYRGSTHRIESG